MSPERQKHNLIRYPSDRVKFENPQSDLERLPGVHFLTVDLTPDSLKNRIQPLEIHIAEIEPRINGKVISADQWLNNEFFFDQRHRAEDGIIIHTGTHIGKRSLKEPLSIALALSIRDQIAHTEERQRIVVVSAEFGQAANSLLDLMDQYGLNQKEIEGLDINRHFIGLFDTPKNPIEEFTQNYMRFLLSRYGLLKGLFLDLHSDPTEHLISPYAILDRTVALEEKSRYWAVVTKLFKNISVVWDLEDKTYKREGLDCSLTAKMLEGLGGALTSLIPVTIECSAGDMDAEDLSFMEDTILQAMERHKIILLTKREKIMREPTANSCFWDGKKENQQLRRQWMPIVISDSGIVAIDGHVLGKVIEKGGKIGEVIATDYPPRDPTSIIAPNQCYILGVPPVDIIEAKNHTIYISVVVPERQDLDQKSVCQY